MKRFLALTLALLLDKRRADKPTGGRVIARQAHTAQPARVRRFTAGEIPTLFPLPCREVFKECEVLHMKRKGRIVGEYAHRVIVELQTLLRLLYRQALTLIRQEKMQRG